MDKELKQRLVDIVAEWDEEELDDWISDYLHEHHQEEKDKQRAAIRAEMRALAILQEQVRPYLPHPDLPPLKVDGALHDIGFIYDEDKDDRVLLAIDQLKGNDDIIAVAEHEGLLTIYTKHPTGLTSISIPGDEWAITELFPSCWEWVCLNEFFCRLWSSALHPAVRLIVDGRKGHALPYRDGR
jgi:hypothetical protein